MASSVARSLYRALLRTASRAIDGKRMHMLLAAPRNRSFDMIKGEFTALETSSRTTAHPADDIIHRAVYRLMNGSRLCVPILERHGSFRDALSQSLRQALDREPSPSDDQALDHGFKLLRRLEEIASVGDSLQAPEDVNLEPLAPLRLQPCTLIGPEGPSPTSGSILARHPLLKRDVVMLLSAYDGWDGFAMGLVLNDPTDARVGATPLLASRGQTVARDASARDHTCRGSESCCAPPRARPSGRRWSSSSSSSSSSRGRRRRKSGRSRSQAAVERRGATVDDRVAASDGPTRNTATHTR